MTLSRFLSRYIYFPLGGNRKGKARQCLNLLLVFLASGLWHGANWTFVIWGLLHGLAVVFETLFPKARFRFEWLNRFVTLLFVTLTFSIFRSDSLEMAALLWQKLFTAGNSSLLFGICNTLNFAENYIIIEFLRMAAPELLNWLYLSCMILLSVISVVLLRGVRAQQWIQEKGHTAGGILLMASLFTWSFISLSQVSVFLYFNF